MLTRLTRLSGSRLLNFDLIERVDGIREYRGAVIAESAWMGAASDAASANPSARRLVDVPDSLTGTPTPSSKLEGGDR